MIVFHLATPALAAVAGSADGRFGEVAATMRASGRPADVETVGGATVLACDVEPDMLAGVCQTVGVSPSLADDVATKWGLDTDTAAALTTAALAFAGGMSSVPTGLFDFGRDDAAPGVVAVSLGGAPLLLLSTDRTALLLGAAATEQADAEAVTTALTDEALAMRDIAALDFTAGAWSE